MIRICGCTQWLKVAQKFAGRVKDVCEVSQSDARRDATVGDSAQGGVEGLLISGQSSRLVSHTVADVENSNGSNNKSLVDEREQEWDVIAERCYERTLDRESRSTAGCGCPLLGGLGIGGDAMRLTLSQSKPGPQTSDWQRNSRS